MKKGTYLRCVTRHGFIQIEGRRYSTNAARPGDTVLVRVDAQDLDLAHVFRPESEALIGWAFRRTVPHTRLRAPSSPPMGAREPARPRDCSRAVWLWLAETNRKIEDSWIGDLIGAICLFIMIGSFWILPLIYEVFK